MNIKHPLFSLSLLGLLSALPWLGPQAAKGGEPAESEREILYWVAPMDPSYRRDKPGKSPMGMDLVPVYADEAGPRVKISPAVVQSLGVRTATAERGTLWRRIDTVGYVQPDEDRMTHVSLRTDGWVERLSVKYEGERVRKGQLLFELYSPALVNAQEEYLQALVGGSRKLIRASRDRLEVLGVSADQIETLTKSRRVRQRIKVYAPQDGIVQQLNVREGMFVRPANMLMSLVDLASIWVVAEVFESQAEWVAPGAPATMRLSYLPGRQWEGEVDFVYPTLDPKTRTLRVRLRFDNPDETLKPNMYASVTVLGDPKPDALVIPAEALIRTGAEQRVIVAAGEGTFGARPVRAGVQVNGTVEILEGLEAGERVVTSGQFLLDSEASLNASLQRMEASQEAGDRAGAKVERAVSGHTEAPVAGAGIVRAVMAGHGMLTLEHEPIEALGWPAMTMDFRTADGVALDSLKEGDAVYFELRKQAEGYVITAIAPRSGKGAAR
ncbi:MAG: efflux RND transporter periplasmic adaptor subunit [Gammaproteobacteria bacterium]|nr:efflux RND transporter periplasmic adaptor subunit [Gammaproteobacteria bacterium]NIR28300.1 efflux RND transporter periplasmic adaptor subunit [Gammaproteobacteria bacterium]NIR96714.1 efflux RND transporter periplasmic adaptor subunit [Gammaproteobacteria bacterium]NIT62415.1 efflux RND transporter periplasmic adaptor subunit [Gammaproteobacteria bacterium]NIV19349.1 efflux RND transporter periplasmic adaptor subunit [Gammaproteobacteria bacterium]